jgi:hypothetical protein
MWTEHAKRKLAVVAAVAVVMVAGGWYKLLYRGVGGDLTVTAKAFLETLTPEQKAQATLPYDNPLRLDWHFIPKPERKGLQIKDMTDEQRKAAHHLLQAGLSNLGYEKVTTIMSLEAILRELEKSRQDGPIRDPERYYFTLFGEPDARGTWGLSIEGHHLSLNFVVQDGAIASTTPTFLGANPATVKGDHGLGHEPGLQVLKPEESTGFTLLHSLDEEQRKTAMISDEAPADIRAAAEPQAPHTAPEGLAAKDMTEAQVQNLWELLSAYTANMPQEVGEARLDAVQDAGIENVSFAWAGATQPGVGHYYRVQGPSFLIEFVNTQPDAEGNVANHIHCVWRDMAGDFAIPYVAAE